MIESAITSNISNYDINGELDVSIKNFNINEIKVKCPLCEHTGNVLTIAHITMEHDLSIDEARKVRDSAHTVRPYLQRGEKLREQRKLISEDRKRSSKSKVK